MPSKPVHIKLVTRCGCVRHLTAEYFTPLYEVPLYFGPSAHFDSEGFIYPAIETRVFELNGQRDGEYWIARERREKPNAGA